MNAIKEVLNELRMIRLAFNQANGEYCESKEACSLIGINNICLQTTNKFKMKEQVFTTLHLAAALRWWDNFNLELYQRILKSKINN